MGETDLTSWDDPKREKNIKKHAYDFPTIREIFDGRFHIVREDKRKDYGEQRLNMLVEYRLAIINITFTPRNNKYHLISVRPASRSERKVYHDRQQAG